MKYITGKEVMNYGNSFFSYLDEANKLFIYRAGNICRKCLHLLDSRMKEKISAIIVSSIKNNTNFVDGIEVKEVDNCIPDKDASILIAIKDKTIVSEITENLIEKGFKKIIAVDDEKLQLYKRLLQIVNIDGYLEHDFLYTEICIDEIYKKALNIGKFLNQNFQYLEFHSLAMVWGGSSLLDYALLRGLVQKYKIETYLEIGTYIGDSLTVISDLVGNCYSISVPENHPAHMRHWCRSRHINDYSNKLVTEKNMIQFQEDSKNFDYKKIQENIGLYYIDGDHSYEGVFIDSVNVSEHFDPENDFIVWHDCRTAAGVDMDVIYAIRDAIGEYFNNFYIFDNSMSGIYIPEKYKDDFCMASKEDELITYKVTLSVNLIEP